MRTPRDANPWTMSVPDAGLQYFGLSRGAAYAAADRGDIPTIRVGRLRRVPIKIIEGLFEVPVAANANLKPPSRTAA